jgi:hypothetical protein
MSKVYEFVEDVTGSVTGTSDLFSVQKPPYIDGSVRVYINGLLKRRGDQDGWTEENSVLGTVRLKEIPELRSSHPIEPKDVIHIRYLTFEPPVADPKDPIHITQLQRGDVVRIATKPGYHINLNPNPRAKIRWTSPSKGQNVEGHSRTVFFAYINTNDPINGQMIVTVQKRTSSKTPNLEGLILYKNIQHIQRYVTDVDGVVETAPATHPGAKAFGTLRRERIGPTLIRVLI